MIHADFTQRVALRSHFAATNKGPVFCRAGDPSCIPSSCHRKACAHGPERRVISAASQSIHLNRRPCERRKPTVSAARRLRKRP